MALSSSKTSHSKISICTFLITASVRSLVLDTLHRDHYTVNPFVQVDALIDYIRHHVQHIDCLVLEHTSDTRLILERLHQQAILLPGVIILPETTASNGAEGASAAAALERPPEKENPSENSSGTPPSPSPQTDGEAAYREREGYPKDEQFPLNELYPSAIETLPVSDLENLQSLINQVIEKFLDLSPQCDLDAWQGTYKMPLEQRSQAFLLLHQQRLAQKLKERLGYLGVYYRRNPNQFLRRLSPEEKQHFLVQLKRKYREIVMHYFDEDASLNQRIDAYVSMLFFSDVPTSRVVEIHMALMDDLSKQLKLEGRSEEILLDYRLTLIDTLANLCEMYRRSVPRES